jgi:predicted nucleic acid-binding protein
MEHEYLAIPVESGVLTQARSLTNSHPLRTLDALQLASAQFVTNLLQEPVTFITADKILSQAAKSEGFSIDDPGAHP